MHHGEFEKSGSKVDQGDDRGPRHGGADADEESDELASKTKNIPNHKLYKASTPTFSWQMWLLHLVAAHGSCSNFKSTKS